MAQGIVGSAVTGSVVWAAAASSGTATIDAAWMFLSAQAPNIQLFLGMLGSNLEWARPLSKLIAKIAQFKILKK